ncbi:MAG: hypothetical protein KGM98_11280 [Bacteroidota bacterium]|nr:hypothetical protein [Bacteroidota bacterium]
MIRITPDDLVRYLYKETSEGRAAEIKAALEADWNLQQSYEEIVAAQKNLGKASLSPRDEVVNRILQHASQKLGQLHSH